MRAERAFAWVGGCVRVRVCVCMCLYVFDCYLPGLLTQSLSLAVEYTHQVDGGTGGHPRVQSAGRAHRVRPVTVTLAGLQEIIFQRGFPDKLGSRCSVRNESRCDFNVYY